MSIHKRSPRSVVLSTAIASMLGLPGCGDDGRPQRGNTKTTTTSPDAAPPTDSTSKVTTTDRPANATEPNPKGKEDAAKLKPRPTCDQVRLRVRAIISEQMGVRLDRVTESKSFVNDLGCDSLDCVELVMEFEDEFDVRIADDDAIKMQLVGDAITYLCKATSAK